MSWILRTKDIFTFLRYVKINVIVADKIDKTPCQPAYLKADHCLREKTERVFDCLEREKIRIILCSILVKKNSQFYRPHFMSFDYYGIVQKCF